MSDAESGTSAALKRTAVLRRGLITTLLNRASAAVVSLVLLPISLRYLGVSDYGAWSAAASITALAAFADLGIGSGLMTKLGALQGQRDDLRESRQVVASAYLVLFALTLALLAGLFFIEASISWATILRLEGPEASQNVSTIVFVTLMSVVANIAASLIIRVQYGVGQQASSNVWQTIGNLSGLGAAAAIAFTDQGKIEFVVAITMSQPLASALNTLHFFFFTRTGRLLRPALGDLRMEAATGLARTGANYLLVSVLLAVSTTIDPWIVSQTHSLIDVPTFSVPSRLFMTLGSVAVLAAVPLWPLNSEALARGDLDWVRKHTVRMSFLLGITILLLGSVGVLLGPWFLDNWLSRSVPMDYSIWIALALWWVMQSALSPLFMVQNAVAFLKPQLVAYTALALVANSLKFWASSTWGIWTIPWISCLCYALIIVPICVWGYRYTLANHGGLAHTIHEEKAR